MNILILGSGGREHAVAWKLSKSLIKNNLWIAPGNAGTSALGENVDLNILDFDAIKKFVIGNDIQMIFVGPEEPLVRGIYDYIVNSPDLKYISVIGPSQTGAMLEGSKDFAKNFMIRHNIPTAKFKTFSKENIKEAAKYLESLEAPYVLKADGLAAGKGVVICKDLTTAKSELNEIILKSKFAKAGEKVVIEQFLKGTELSVFIATDGISYRILPSAKDYKKIGKNDTGLNTGGMGAISPAPFLDNKLLNIIEKSIIIPTLNGLKSEKIIYKGFLYFGLMIVDEMPYVIEYNVRLGDPEAEVIIPRIKSDLTDLLKSIAFNYLYEYNLITDDNFSACVMLVSGGYPLEYVKGKEILDLDLVKDSLCFHSGSVIDEYSGKVVTNGGRVMAICSTGITLKEALEKSNKNAEIIQFENKYFRDDIGYEF